MVYALVTAYLLIGMVVALVVCDDYDDSVGDSALAALFWPVVAFFWALGGAICLLRHLIQLLPAALMSDFTADYVRSVMPVDAKAQALEFVDGFARDRITYHAKLGFRACHMRPSVSTVIPEAIELLRERGFAAFRILYQGEDGWIQVEW